MIYWHVKKYDELVNQKQKADAFLADEEVKSISHKGCLQFYT